MMQIITTGHWITDQITGELKEFDTTEPQFNVLKEIDCREGKAVTVQEIQEGMVQKSSNVTRIVDKLLKKGYVHRELNAENRRKVNITLTKEGATFLKKLDAKVSAFHTPMQKNLTTIECEQLTKLIKKLKGN